MKTKRLPLSAACVFSFFFLFAFAFGIVFLSQPTPAYADLTGTALTTQSDSTRISRDMLTLIDKTPCSEGVASLTVTNGSTVLTKGTHYTLTPSGKASDDGGKTVTVSGYGSLYSGKVKLTYHLSIAERSGDPVSKLEECITVKYSGTKFDVVQTEDKAGSITATRNDEESTITIQGAGDLEGQSATLSYAVEEGSAIDKSMITLAPSEQGSDVAISVAVKDGDKNLQENVDYTATVASIASLSQAYKVTVAGQGLYSGSVEYYCVIDNDSVVEKTLLTDSMLTLDQTVFVANGQVQKPTVTVKDGSAELKEAEQYQITTDPADSLNPGNYTLKVYGIGDYVGQVERSYTICSEAADSDFTAFLVESEGTYNNATYKDKCSVTVTGSDGTPLSLVSSASAETDGYVVVYPDDMTNAGEKSIIIQGTNSYAGKARKLTYTINQFDLSATNVVSTYTYTANSFYISSITSQTFTGGELTPEPSTVWCCFTSTNYRALTKGTDYELAYSNNVNAADSTSDGPPRVTVKGIGNFKGEQSLAFTINKANMYNATYDSVSDKIYSGSQWKPAVTNVKLGDYKLTEGVDYDVSYGSNTSAGTGYVYLKGKSDNFYTTDSSSYYKTVSFNINAKSINSGDVSVSRVANQTYTGSAITPTLTVADSKAKVKLVEQPSYYQTYDSYGYFKYGYMDSGPYYCVEYSNNTNPGTATIKLIGVANYTGTRTVTFNINGTGMCPIVKATNKGGGKVVLKWNPIYKATKYMIQEKMPNGSYKTLSSNCQSTACTISNLSVTRKHRFLVRAYVNGKWSSNSDVYLVSIKPTGASKPTARGFSASKTSVTVSWNSVPGADCYAIYQKSGSSYRALTSSYTYTSVHLTQLKKKGKYTYYIRAYVDGKWTGKSNKVTISPADPNPPVVTAVGGVGKGKVKLTWTKARNAKKYMVQVRLANGKWKTLTKNCKKRTYTAKGLTASRSHTFRVRAYGNGKWSKVYSDYNVSATPDNA